MKKVDSHNFFSTYNQQAQNMQVLLAIALAFGTLVSAAPATNETTAQASEQLTAPQRAEKIKDAFLFAYHGYEEHAFGHDEALSLSGGKSDSR